MAIAGPGTIDAAALGPQRSGGRQARTLLEREEWSSDQGKKVQRRRCGSDDRGEAVPGQIKPERGRVGACRTAAQDRRLGAHLGLTARSRRFCTAERYDPE